METAGWMIGWIIWMTNVSWQVVLVAALIGLLSWTLRGRSARLRYALWLVVLAKLFVPPILAMPWGTGTWIARPMRQEGSSGIGPRSAGEESGHVEHSSQQALVMRAPSLPAEMEWGIPSEENLGNARSATTQTAASGALEAVTPVLALFILWGAGLISYATLVILRIIGFRRILGRAREVEEGPLRVDLEKLTCALGLAHAPALLVSDEVPSPLLCGAARPRIILPTQLISTLSDSELRMILLHELIHLKRRDLWIGWLQTIAQGLYWFHPVVWIVNAQIRHERERACDEAALDRTDWEKPDAYAETIMKALLAARGQSQAGLIQPGIFERSARLQQRLEGILDARGPRKAGWPAWITIAAVGLFLLSIGAGGDAQSEAKSASAEAVELRSVASGLADLKQSEQIEAPDREMAAAADATKPEAEPEPAHENDSLQARIDRANAGATIQLEAETYMGPIQITKPITLAGITRGQTILELVGDEPLIRIRGTEGVTLKDMTLRWSLASTDAKIDEPAAVAARDSKVDLRLCRLEPVERAKQTPYGLLVAGRSEARFLGSETSGFAYAIMFMDGTKGSVELSTLTDAGHAEISAMEGCEVYINRCTIGRSDYHGIRVSGGTVRIEDNVIEANQRAGVYLGNKSAHGTIANNVFRGNRGGIWGYAGSDATIEHNIFIDSKDVGVSFLDSCNLTLRGNSFINNAAGVIRYLKSPTPGPGAIAEGNHYWKNQKDTVDFDRETSALEGDPQFADPENFNFAPGAGSPLLDALGARAAGLSVPGRVRPRANSRPPVEKAAQETAQRAVRVVLGKDTLTLEGEPVEWDNLHSKLEGVENRGETVLEFAVDEKARDQITIKQLEDATGRIILMGNELGFKYVSSIGAHPLRSKGEDKAAKTEDMKSVEVAAAAANVDARPGGPPRIVSTVPEIGASEVDPALTEIAIIFDRDMGGGMSWTGGGEVFPMIPEGKKPNWRDKQTCVLPVTLEAGRFYRVGINSSGIHNFRSADTVDPGGSKVDGMPIDPQVLYFTTQGAGEEVKARLHKPVIVSFAPNNGEGNVDAGTTELRVTFDVPVGGGASWCGGGEHFPEIPEGGRFAFSKDMKTCTLPVKLKPGWEYELGINCPSFNNFQSEWGVPLDPVRYSFKTK